MTRTMTRSEISQENSPVPLLSIHDLSVSFETEAGIIRAIALAQHKKTSGLDFSDIFHTLLGP